MSAANMVYDRSKGGFAKLVLLQLECISQMYFSDVQIWFMIGVKRGLQSLFIASVFLKRIS